MIGLIGQWIKQIILLILIATFLDLLLPNSGMRRYVKLVVGLLLILVILSPVLELFQFDFERLLTVQEEWDKREETMFSNRVSANRERLEGWQEAAILKEVASQWEKEIKRELEDRFQLQVVDLQLKLISQKEEAQIESVSLVLKMKEDSLETDSQGTPKPIEPVKPVVIDLAASSRERELEELSFEQEKKIEEEVLTYLSKEWNISVDKMTCTWVRR